MSADELFPVTSGDYGDSFAEHQFETYKLFVGSAHEVSERRTAANNYLLTVNALLVSLASLSAGLTNGGEWLVAIPAAGILVSFAWWVLISNYKNLNSAKFDVIHDLERKLPAAPFTSEWSRCQNAEGRVYRPLSHIERWIPLVFAGLYAVLIIGILVIDG